MRVEHPVASFKVGTFIPVIPPAVCPGVWMMREKCMSRGSFHRVRGVSDPLLLDVTFPLLHTSFLRRCVARVAMVGCVLMSSLGVVMSLPSSVP